MKSNSVSGDETFNLEDETSFRDGQVDYQPVSGNSSGDNVNIDKHKTENEINSDAKMQKLMDENAELKLKVDELTDIAKRSQADFINFKKRVEIELLKKEEEGELKVYKDLLLFIDEIELARFHEGENSFIKSLKEKIDALLIKKGIEAYGSEGDLFSPKVHNSIEHNDDNNGTVVITKVYQRGYAFGDRIIREAVVGTGNKKE